mmetsp:Transcript_134636/g.340247  ORF Transcript_134636/g.340247 Transcript_134636/m.340247 type:complete len:610 (+) Transcript_134636:60-1889(+)
MVSTTFGLSFALLFVSVAASTERGCSGQQECPSALDEEDAPLLLQLSRGKEDQAPTLKGTAGAVAEARFRARRGRQGPPRRPRWRDSVCARPTGKFFAQAFGSGFSWFVGNIVSDVVSLAGASAEGKFGLISMGSVEIGNPFPEEIGPSSTDGILGLFPGCWSGSACGENRADVVSSLVQGGALSAYVFTFCGDDGPSGGGKFYLGPSSSSLPENTRRFPMSLENGHYYLSGPSDDSLVTFTMGLTDIGNMTAADWASSLPLTDTGFGGFNLPEEYFFKAVEIVAEAIFSNAECGQKWASQFSKQGLMKALKNHSSFHNVSDLIKCAEPLIPGFTVQIGPHGNFTVLGSTFFYETSPGSNVFEISWRPRNSFLFGTALNWGNVWQYDVSNKQAPELVFLGRASGCAVDYSQGQKHSIKLSGVKGQVLNIDIGVYTAEVTIGTPPQKFLVQLDTGSQDFMVYGEGCSLFGLDNCMGTNFCDTCLAVFDTKHNGTAYIEPYPWIDENPAFSAACALYMAPLLAPAEDGSSEFFPYKQAITGLTLEQFQGAAEKRWRPYARCAATREICGTRRIFNQAASSTFAPKNLRSPRFQDPPSFKAPEGFNCDSGAP